MKSNLVFSSTALVKEKKGTILKTWFPRKKKREREEREKEKEKEKIPEELLSKWL